MSDSPRFGAAGLSDSFAASGFKSPRDIATYHAGFGLTAFEVQCGRGVRMPLDKAAVLGAQCAEKNIALSVHAPYYISMSSMEEEKRLHSVDYLLQSCALVKALGGRRVIFHAGSCGKQSREAALEKALDTMRRAVEAVDAASLPASTSAICMPAPTAASPGRRTMRPSSTAWPRRWGMTGRCISTPTSPALPTPQAEKSAISPLPIPSSARPTSH